MPQKALRLDVCEDEVVIHIPVPEVREGGGVDDVLQDRHLQVVAQGDMEHGPNGVIQSILRPDKPCSEGIQRRTDGLTSLDITQSLPLGHQADSWC